MKRCIAILCLACALGAAPAAGEPAAKHGIYSKADLEKAGRVWQRTKAEWQAAQSRYRTEVNTIERQPWSSSKKAAARQRAKVTLDRTSQRLAMTRDKVQRIMMAEANARLGPRPGTGASADLTPTAGTKPGQPGHRGMPGDLDAGGGQRTVEKLKQVMGDMGFDVHDPTLLKETPGTLEVGDDFEFTVNKTGAKARPGTEYHRVEVEVNAANKETYVSESMRKGQPGREYTAVQDHRKKAMGGLTSDGDKLVSSKAGRAKMQGMAKGASKSIVDADLSPDELKAIMRRRGIEGTPDEFHKRLQDIKEAKVEINDPVEAERIRKASQDVFDAAETKTLNQAKAEIVDTRQRIQELELKGNKGGAQALRDELADTMAKMKTTKRVNDAAATTARQAAPEVEGPKKAPGKVAQGLQVVGAVMTIADIGNGARNLERYLDGEIPLEEAVTGWLDASLTLGMIGTTMRTWQSYDDHKAAVELIEQANRANVQHFWTGWELQLRKAGVPVEEARRLIADAIESGDTMVLDVRADALEALGKPIERPQLVIDTFEADDTWYQRGGEVLQGMGVGVYDGVGYIVSAPSRVVKAWGDAELEIATLEAETQDQQSWMRARIYQRLRRVGLPREQVFQAIDDFYDGKDLDTLRRLFRYAREQIRDERYVNIRRDQRDWYCTNRPQIEAPVAVPPLVRK